MVIAYIWVFPPTQIQGLSGLSHHAFAISLLKRFVHKEYNIVKGGGLIRDDCWRGIAIQSMLSGVDFVVWSRIDAPKACSTTNVVSQPNHIGPWGKLFITYLLLIVFQHKRGWCMDVSDASKDNSLICCGFMGGSLVSIYINKRGRRKSVFLSEDVLV